MRDSFVFYSSFHKALKVLSFEEKSAVLDSICEFALFDIPVDLEKHTSAGQVALILIEPQLKANIKRYTDGHKGGAPKGNKNAQRNKNNQRLKQKQPNENENENYNDNANENHNVNENDIKSLFYSDLILDVPISLSLEEYQAIAEKYNATEWLKTNYRHLSKIHKYADRIKTGYYDRTIQTADHGDEILKARSYFDDDE
jgi:hypothetical protein